VIRAEVVDPAPSVDVVEGQRDAYEYVWLPSIILQTPSAVGAVL
jgi:hypothetical protein